MGLERLETRALLTRLPEGFVDVEVAADLAFPAALEIDPAGRLYFLESGNGKVRVIEDGELRPDPVLSVAVDVGGERGLFAFTFDPGTFDEHEDDSMVHYIYIYYTTKPTPESLPANRVSRYEFDPEDGTVDQSTEDVLLQFDPVESYYHNGGGLAFGPDGKLYVGVGDNMRAESAQRLDDLLGKVLRINPDGSIPADNPLLDQTEGRNGAIWAYGFRNPFSLTIQPQTGDIYINDVGTTEWEEVNLGRPGGNYGWPEAEGPSDDPRFITPYYAYPHDPFQSVLRGSAVTSAEFYLPETPQFPSEYEGSLFIADFVFGIKRLDPASGTATWFAEETAPLVVDLVVAPDGSLYYVSIDEGGLTGTSSTSGSIRRISYTGVGAPDIASQPRDLVVAFDSAASFEVVATGPAPYTYQWQKDGVDVPGATDATYAIASAALADDGSLYRVVVRNALGSVTSREAKLTVVPFQGPTVRIDSPSADLTWKAGDTITFESSATWADGLVLPPSSFTWWVDFQHDTHLHPFVSPTSGTNSGSFTIPTLNETDPDVWYRIRVVATDEQGLSADATRDIYPRKSQVTLATSPPGLPLMLDGGQTATPTTFTAVVGVERTLGIPADAQSGGVTWVFDYWSDGGDATRVFSAGEADSTITAVFRSADDSLNPVIDLVLPPTGLAWTIGQTIAFSATAADAEGDALPPSAFTWLVDLHQGGEVTSVLGPLSGVLTSSFTIPPTLADGPAAFYRLRVEVVDKFGLRSVVTRDLFPKTAVVSLRTVPEGLELLVDGRRVVSPLLLTSVVGAMHDVAVPGDQERDGVSYTFDSWSDGGPASRRITTPESDATYTAVLIGSLPSTTVSRPTLSDYNGDGVADPALHRAERDGAPPAFVIDGPGGVQTTYFGRDGDISVSGDFDGDRIADVAVFRPQSDRLPGASEWFILGSKVGGYSVLFGGAGLDVPAPADFDGDGITDLAVFRPESDLLPGASEWFILGSRTGANRVLFGKAGSDIPVPADYDGDGTDDLAVYRPESDLVAGAGHFFALRSTAGAIAFAFGAAGTDVPVPADYDGDGRADFAVYRPETAEWFVLGTTAGASATAFGSAGDVPAPADYDGDDAADLATFNTADGLWKIRRSTDLAALATTPGQAGDLPVLTPLSYRDRGPGALLAAASDATPPKRKPYSWRAGRWS